MTDNNEQPQGRTVSFLKPVNEAGEVQIVFFRHAGKCLVYRFLGPKLFDATRVVMRHIRDGVVPFVVGTRIIAAMRKLCGC